MNLSANREIERMFHEECITRQALRRRQEREVRRKEVLNRSIEDHRRSKEETRVRKEKQQYVIYELYKQGDHHKHLLYYREPYTLDLELLLRIEEEERREIENRRRAKENARWAIEDQRTREEDRDNLLHRRRFAFQELGFHLRVLEILQMTHHDPRIHHVILSYHKEAVLCEMKCVHFYRAQLDSS
jgi:hypothetical protein